MSRKHFILLAAALRIQREQTRISLTLENREALIDELIYTVATVCASNNPNFSHSRFFEAANYKGIDNVNS